MSNEKNNINFGISLNYSNRKLTEFPKELYKHKLSLISLDISSNPLLDLDHAINELKEFKSLKRLKINIETGAEAKKLIDALPFLKVLNDITIHEEEEKKSNDIDNNIKENININNIIINENINKKAQNEDKNNFEKILEKIKEYDNITKEKYDLIINDYNKLISNNNIKNTLEICSYFNKVLINLIKDAQDKNNIKTGSLKPLLEAQSQNESIRINYESKINSVNNNSYIIKTETTSLSQASYLNSNNNLNIKNVIKRDNSTNNYRNKNEIRKEYSKNIKNMNSSLSKSKSKNKDSNKEKEKDGDKNNITFSIEDYLEENIKKKKEKNTSINKTENDNNNIKPKKKFRFTQKHKSHKKMIVNKISLQYNQENTDINSNLNTNINTDYNNNNNITIKSKTSEPSNPNKKLPNIYTKKIKYNQNDIQKNIGKATTISSISENNNNYISKYDMLKNCVENSTINSILLNIEKKNFSISNIFDNLKEIITYDYTSIRVLNLKNLLEIINQVYKQRMARKKKKNKGTLEIDLMSYLKSKYGLKKLIIEWCLIIFSSIKAYSKINGEVCLFGLVLKNELDENSIDILQKIKETVSNILNPLYKYNIAKIEKIRNNKEFMLENEWNMITQIIYSNDENLRLKFVKKIENFVKNMIKNEKLMEKIGKKILFCDFLNLLIMFNLRLRRKYLKNLVNFFKEQDKERYGIINYEEFKLMIEKIGLKDNIEYLIENSDKECMGYITFNDVVECFDNFYVNKIKLLDNISNLKYIIN